MSAAHSESLSGSRLRVWLVMVPFDSGSSPSFELTLWPTVAGSVELRERSAHVVGTDGISERRLLVVGWASRFASDGRAYVDYFREWAGPLAFPPDAGRPVGSRLPKHGHRHIT